MATPRRRRQRLAVAAFHLLLLVPGRLSFQISRSNAFRSALKEITRPREADAAAASDTGKRRRSREAAEDENIRISDINNSNPSNFYKHDDERTSTTRTDQSNRRHPPRYFFASSTRKSSIRTAESINTPTSLNTIPEEDPPYGSSPKATTSVRKATTAYRRAPSVTGTGRQGRGALSSSRREWLQLGAATVLAGGALAAAVGTADPKNQKLQFLQGKGNSLLKTTKQKLAPINFTAVVRETSINVTMECTTSCVSLDTTTFQKKQTVKLPAWFPPSLVPPPRVIKDIPNTELLTAAVIAGSAVEMSRSALLYPLLTLKTRIQNDVNHRQSTRNVTKFNLKRRLQILRLNAKRHFDEGNLYAGIVPSLLVSVPATGVYYGVRDVSKRAIAMLTPLGINSVQTAVIAAFLADVVSLMVRTPADALAIRLQVATGEEARNLTVCDDVDEKDGNNTGIAGSVLRNSSAIGNDGEVCDVSEEAVAAAVEAKVGNWFVESIERLPAVILTDLPYLLSRIAINKALIGGYVDIGRYEATVVATGLLLAFLTTPFDVARTRILVDSDDDPENGIDGGSGEGLIKTMKTIMNEGDGGVGNLFAGWLERTLYLGIGRACLEPFQLVGYTAIRDAILLEVFD